MNNKQLAMYSQRRIATYSIISKIKEVASSTIASIKKSLMDPSILITIIVFMAIVVLGIYIAHLRRELNENKATATANEAELKNLEMILNKLKGNESETSLYANKPTVDLLKDANFMINNLHKEAKRKGEMISDLETENQGLKNSINTVSSSFSKLVGILDKSTNGGKSKAKISTNEVITELSNINQGLTNDAEVSKSIGRFDNNKSTNSLSKFVEDTSSKFLITSSVLIGGGAASAIGGLVTKIVG